MLELHISEELRKVLPRQLADERKQLAANIRKEGRVVSPILYWYDGKQNVIVDGMNRWEIVQEIDDQEIPYQTKKLDFKCIEEAEIWILENALGQRNLKKPADQRKVCAKLYNTLKQQRGGDRKSKGQNEPLIRNAAAQVASKAGLSVSTVKRRVNTEAKIEAMSQAAQAACEGATNADIDRMAKLSSSDQTAVARAIRTGQANSIRAAIKATGAKPKAPAKRAKPSKKLEPPAYYKQYYKAIGPVVRLVDKIANGVGEKNSAKHKAVHAALNKATTEMKKWMGVK